VTTLTEVLSEQGYGTLAVVSNTLLVKTRRLHRGFEVYDLGNSGRTAGSTTAAALGHLEHLDHHRPLFAWVHYFDPHVPYHTDPSIAEAFDPGYAGPYRSRFGLHAGDGAPLSEGRGYPEDLPKEVATHRNPLPEAVNAHIRRLYAADIRATDEAVRELVAGFREIFGSRLLLVLTADHGESLGEHDFYFDHGDYVYNAGTRVPLGFVLPEGHPDRRRGRCAQWVSLVDVVPTLLELLDIEPGPRLRTQIEGRSLVPCMRGEPLGGEPVFAEAGHSWFIRLVPRRKLNDIPGRFRSVTLGDWKLIWTPLQTGDRGWELYNLREDPDETLNLYHPDHPQVEPLRQRLAEWTKQARPAPPARPLSDDDRERLRALGYAE
jgi:arylsulfatase A-like enzyme